MVALVRPIKITSKQAEFRRGFPRDCKQKKRRWLRGLVSGRGGGKTFIGALDISQTAKRGQDWLAVSPDNNMIRSTTLPTFVEVVKRTGQYIKHVTTPTPCVTFSTNDGGTARIYFRGAEKPDKLRGGSFAGVWFDEASIITKEAFDIAIGTCRFRGVMGPVLCTFTPRGFKHWTFSTFFEPVSLDRVEFEDATNVRYFKGKPFKPVKDTFLVQCSTRDNYFAPEEFADRVGSNYSSVFRQQEIDGDYVEIAGTMFQREWFRYVDDVPRDCQRIRYWDRAATQGSGCYTAGVLLAKDRRGIFYVEHVVRGQWGALERNAIIKDTARSDDLRFGGEVITYIEHEGSGSSKDVTEALIRELAEYPVYSDLAASSAMVKVGGVLLPGDAKIRRASPFSAQAEAGNIRVVGAEWTQDFLDELTAFPNFTYCDQVDAVSAAYLKLAKSVPDHVVTSREGISADFGWSGQMLQNTDSTSTSALLGALPW